MKALALVGIILLVMLTGIVGILYFFGFVMSFDAPGSDKDPSAWQARLLMLIPVAGCFVLLICSIITYAARKYRTSAILAALPILLAIVGFIAMAVTSMTSLSDYRKEMAREAELAKKYPVEKYLRPTDMGTDTIIVWPNGIVAYRLLIGLPKAWGGPLGDLNASRDTLFYYAHQDTRLRREELREFLDQRGFRFDEVYVVK